MWVFLCCRLFNLDQSWLIAGQRLLMFNVEQGNTFNLETNNYPLYSPGPGMKGNNNDK